jgi:hypothetical protein
MARKIATCLTALILTGLIFVGYHKVLFTQNLAIATSRNVEAVEKDFPWNTVRALVLLAFILLIQVYVVVRSLDTKHSNGNAVTNVDSNAPVSWLVMI